MDGTFLRYEVSPEPHFNKKKPQGEEAQSMMITLSASSSRTTCQNSHYPSCKRKDGCSTIFYTNWLEQNR